MTYWLDIHETARQRQAAAFERWRASRYTDSVARDEFLAMFCAAHEAVVQARRVQA
jgi:hypothetical protein